MISPVRAPNSPCKGPFMSSLPRAFHSHNPTSQTLRNNTVKTPQKLSKSATSCRCQLTDPAVPSSGRINRQVLSNQGRTKMNKYSDREFYSFPRLVKHVDDSFINSLTQLYRDTIPRDSEVLDLMSSWVSHLPEEVKYKRVVGHGLNAQELAKNPRLDHFFIKDLNKEPSLEAKDCSFDAVLIAVSVQYMEQPEKVFAEIFRVLRPGGVCIVSFSNRMFYEKAIGAWRDGSEYSRIQLVKEYFLCVDGFTQPQVVRKVGRQEEDVSVLDRVLGFFKGGIGSDPFYAVVAYRNFKPS